MLFDNINVEIRNAMYSNDKILLNTLRAIKCEFTVEAKSGKVQKSHLKDEECYPLLQKMIKQRNFSIEKFKEGNRDDLVKETEKEIEIISKYLPVQFSDSQIKEEILAIIRDKKIFSIKQKGDLIKLAKEQIGAAAESAKIAQAVDAILKQIEKI